MAVYTALDDDALTAWLEPRRVGTLTDWRGIASGIENSNFYVTTCDDGRDRRFVLTVFERLDEAQLSYYLALMKHLATRGLPCPAPIPDHDGSLHAPLAGKPAALVTRLPGQSVLRPGDDHCAAIGSVLARLHVASVDFDVDLPNPRGFDWWVATARGVRAFLDDAQRALLDDAIASLEQSWQRLTHDLPTGAIHADLFRDNALFDDSIEGPATLGGIIDFYFAGTDVWLLDLAISINDWCVDVESGVLDPSRLQAMIDAYDRERPLIAAEHEALPTVLRAAALRFWLSRLDDLHRPRPAQMLTPHDPARFEKMVRLRRDETLCGRPSTPRGPAG